jgi:hypothetical protein
MAAEEIPTYIYEGLLGARLKNGQLFIRGYADEDYEDLWTLIMEEVIAPALRRRGDDYFHFLGVWAVRYGKHRANARYFDGYDPLTANRPEELTTRQQLAILRHYIYRRYHSGYAAEL